MRICTIPVSALQAVLSWQVEPYFPSAEMLLLPRALVLVFVQVLLLEQAEASAQLLLWEQAWCVSLLALLESAVPSERSHRHVHLHD